jgi:hypothetical protein
MRCSVFLFVDMISDISSSIWVIFGVLGALGGLKRHPCQSVPSVKSVYPFHPLTSPCNALAISSKTLGIAGIAQAMINMMKLYLTTTDNQSHQSQRLATANDKDIT